MKVLFIWVDDKIFVYFTTFAIKSVMIQLKTTLFSKLFSFILNFHLNDALDISFGLVWVLDAVHDTAHRIDKADVKLKLAFDFISNYINELL